MESGRGLKKETEYTRCRRQHTAAKGEKCGSSSGEDDQNGNGNLRSSVGSPLLHPHCPLFLYLPSLLAG